MAAGSRLPAKEAILAQQMDVGVLKPGRLEGQN